MSNRIHIKTFLQKTLKSRDLSVFMVFLFISLCFWLLNALRKEYVATIEIPIVYTRFPNDVLPDPGTERAVSVSIKSGGFQILKYKSFNLFDPVEINVDHLMPYRRGKESGVFFIPKHYVRHFQQQLAGVSEFQEVLTDTVFIPFLPKLTKKLPVKPRLKLSFEKQFMVAGQVKLNPDSVHISGFFKTVDTMRWITTNLLEERNVKESIAKRLPIVIPKGLECSHNTVDVEVPIEAFTEKSIEVPVHVMNLPDNYRFKSFPSSVRVSFWVGMSRFDKIGPSDFGAFVDCNESHGLSAEKLKVKLEKLPQGIHNVTYSPIFVEYLIEKDRY